MKPRHFLLLILPFFISTAYAAADHVPITFYNNADINSGAVAFSLEKYPCHTYGIEGAELYPGQQATTTLVDYRIWPFSREYCNGTIKVTVKNYNQGISGSTICEFEDYYNHDNSPLTFEYSNFGGCQPIRVG